MFLPLFFNSGLSCLVVGGGRVASHKIRILLEARCGITVIAPKISDFVAEQAAARTVRWLERDFRDGDCAGYQLVVAATPHRELNRRISAESRSRCIPINVVDDPELSTVIFPAIWRETPLTVAVSTGGAAPFMAAEIRTRLSRYLRGMGRWVECGKRFRDAVKEEVPDTEEKNALYKRFLDAGPMESVALPGEGARLEDWDAWLTARRKADD